MLASIMQRERNNGRRSKPNFELSNAIGIRKNYSDRSGKFDDLKFFFCGRERFQFSINRPEADECKYVGCV